jgi:uncharacterized protein (DUF488 family)
LLELLRGADIEDVVDVRTAPGSRRNPDVARSAMEQWIPEHGIGYRWEQRLGGWRKDPADSPDTALRNRSFAGYAAHMRSVSFGIVVDELLAAAAATRTAVLCAESVWWRCHRRMLADFAVLARDVPVEHLMPGGRRQMHRLTEGVRLREDGLLVYDGKR